MSDSTALPDASRALNPLVAAMRPSATMAMSGRAQALIRDGRPVISLSAGEPDFVTPDPIREAAIKAVEDGFTMYTANAGMPELREAIAEKLQRENGLAYAPDEIVCSNGAKQAVAQSVLALLQPGEEVLIPAPYWVSYPEMVRLAGGVPVPVETRPEDEYRLTPEALRAAITSETRLLILNSPSNPTGAVLHREHLEAIADVLREHPSIIVISDEIYEYVMFGPKHVSFAAIDGMHGRTITVNGFSKGFAMTGWRLGYLAAPAWISKAAGKIQSQFTSAPSSITQKAGIAALEMVKAGDGLIQEMVGSFHSRRDMVLARLLTLDGVVCPEPEGAFYLFPDVSAYYGRTAPDGRAIDGSEALCFHLLERHDVALVPGLAFGADYGARLSYAAAPADLETAMDRIAAGLAELS